MSYLSVLGRNTSILNQLWLGILFADSSARLYKKSQSSNVATYHKTTVKQWRVSDILTNFGGLDKRKYWVLSPYVGWVRSHGFTIAI